MYKKAICSVALFLVVLMCIPATAFAIEARADSRIAYYRANLYVESDGDLSIYFSITASSKMDALGASKIAIQRYNGSRWITESTLTVANTPDMQASNAIRHSATISYEPDYSGAMYQAVVTFYAKDSSGSSTAQTTTA